MLDFNEIVSRIKEELKIKSDKELYEIMETNQGKYSMWKQRNKIPYEEITTLCCNKNLDLNYILNNKKQQIFINFKEENIKIIEKITKDEEEKLYYILKKEFNS